MVPPACHEPRLSNEINLPAFKANESPTLTDTYGKLIC